MYAILPVIAMKDTQTANVVVERKVSRKDCEDMADLGRLRTDCYPRLGNEVHYYILTKECSEAEYMSQFSNSSMKLMHGNWVVMHCQPVSVQVESNIRNQ